MPEITIKDLEDLYHKIWLRDIPSPTIPEYKELHEKMQESLNDVLVLIEKLNE